METSPNQIDMTAVTSSQIAAIGYDAESRVLAIQFKGKGPAVGSTYRYYDVPPFAHENLMKSDSIGKHFDVNIKGVYAYEKQPDQFGIVFGLPLGQNAKYTTGPKDGRIINRATGKPIPDDEPVFILRASDTWAMAALTHYLMLVENRDHSVAIEGCISDFVSFRQKNPDRMKEPDTTPVAHHPV